MSKLLISKKGNIPISLLVGGAMSVLFGFVLFGSDDFKGHIRGNSEFEDAMTNMLPFLFVLMGILFFVTASLLKKVYISVYDDHIEGAALTRSGLSVCNFHFTKDMKYTVQQDGATVKVTCGGKVYRVKLTAADASEVYHCVINGRASSPATPRPAAAPVQRPTPPVNSNPAQKPVSRPAAKPVSPAPSQPNPTQSIIAKCPSCSASLRIPAGKGTIRLTCPKCKNVFETKS